MPSADPWITLDPRRAPPLAPGRVAVWRMPLPYPACESWGVTLPPADLERVRAAAHPAVRTRHLHTRIVLRVLRACYSGISPAKQGELAGADGKPACAAGALAFNLSHAEGIALLAFSTAGEVGADVETAGRLRPFARLAERFFHPHERAIWRDRGGDEPEFLRIWTAKEALLKAVGTGITVDLSGVDSSVALAGGDWRGFRLRPVPLDIPFAGHLAAEPGSVDWFACPE